VSGISGTLKVRDGRASDADAIAEMIQELVTYEQTGARLSFTVDQLLAAINSGCLRAVVAEDASGLLGFVSYTIDFAIWSGGQIIRVDDVFVRERGRRSGVGRKMMLRVAELAQITAGGVRWEIEPQNLGAQRFYESLGVELRDKVVARWSHASMQAQIKKR
jgi:GNAT superfamily N-acetyltransferase